MNKKWHALFALVIAVGVALLLLVFSRPPASDSRVTTTDDRPPEAAPAGAATVHAEAGLVEDSGTEVPILASVEGAESFSCKPIDESGLYADIRDVALALGQSEDPEHLLMAAIYSGDVVEPSPLPLPTSSSLEYLFKGLDADPNNELLLWNALSLCVQGDDTDACDDHGIPERATTVLGGNANFWLRLAGLRADEENLEGTISALRAAVQAPQFKEYHIEHVEVFARGLAAYNNAPFGERMTTASGLAAGLWSPEANIVQACKREADVGNDWLHLCLSVARTMELEGSTYLTKAIGLDLQKLMYERAGNGFLAGHARLRREAISDEISSLAGTEAAWAVMGHDEQLMEAFVDAWKAGGEGHAFRFLLSEVDRLRAIPGYDPCP